MKSKVVIVLSSLLIYLNIGCQGQVYDSISLGLPGYHVDGCLLDLLSTVAQSNSRYYNVDEYFYSLTYKEGKRSKYISIVPERRSESKYLDYTGGIKRNNITFLFRGEFERDSIFKRSTGSEIKINLRREKGDLDKGAFISEPSLQGGYYECKGMPIYIEVYTKGKIPNFEMKVRPSKDK